MDARRLRDETRAEHEATEALMPLTGPALTRDLYVRVLSILYPLIRGWEQWAAEAAPPHLRPLLHARQRTPLLEADLQTLGSAPLPDARFEQKTPINWSDVVTGGHASLSPDAFLAGFMGAMYVIEGSTLGGRFIARHLESALGLTPGQGDAYFQGHGEATGAMWREITAQISTISEHDAALVIAAARRSFVAFGDALRAGLYAGVTRD